MSRIRPCHDDESEEILRIVNLAAGGLSRGDPGRPLARAVHARGRARGAGPRPSGWIRFYERHGFERIPREQTAELLRAYWTIPERQIETSVVLAHPPFEA